MSPRRAPLQSRIEMKTLTRIVPLFFAFAAAMLSADAARACSCIRENPPCQEFGSSRAVFVGKVTGSKLREEVANPDGSKTVYDVGEIYFKVEEPFSGVKSPTAVIFSGTGGGDCGYWFKRGERYLVYAYGDTPDKLHTNICTRTAPLAEADEDLAFLRNLPRKGVGARIYGSVAAALKDPASTDWRKRQPLPGVTVKVEGRRRTYDAVTDAEGNYELTGLEAGIYKVRPVLPDYYYSDEYSTREFEVSDRGCVRRDFFAQNKSLISGRVVDPEGRGLPKVMVELMPVGGSDSADWRRHDTDFADEQGNFELERIAPGRYLLGINIGSVPDAGAPYPRTFYPGVTDRAQATVIEVGWGRQFKGMNIQLPPRLIEYTVRGVVVWPDGRPAAKATVYVEDVKHPGWCVNGCGSETDALGQFTLRGFAGHTYRVNANSFLQAPENSVRAEPPTITLDGNVDGIRLILSQPEKNDSEEGKSP